MSDDDEQLEGNEPETKKVHKRNVRPLMAIEERMKTKVGRQQQLNLQLHLTMSDNTNYSLFAKEVYMKMMGAIFRKRLQLHEIFYLVIGDKNDFLLSVHLLSHLW